jgi:DNA-binding CsgD family transcriptional regulator
LVVMNEWPLVGRAGEVALVASFLMAEVAGSVVLAGPAGVGKTRLAAEALSAVDRAGFATVRIVATPTMAELPFGALAPFLPPLDRADPGRVDSRADLLRWSAAALVERAKGRRLVVLIDDAHLLDDASAGVIHQMAATGAGSVLATVRSGAPAPEAVLALWKDGIAERVDVGGLTVEAIGDLLAAVLDGNVDQATVLRLALRTEGNVLFLRELVLGALDDGALIADAGMWHLVGELVPSTRLIELVEARLTGLDTAERAVLELVAFAEPLGSAELAELADPAVVDVLHRREMLLSRMSGRRLEVGLVHPVYADVLRARLPALRARTLARSLAEVVEATGARRRTDALRVAVWRLAGGGAKPDLLLAGAEAAQQRFDLRIAERLARAAMDAGAGFEAALLAATMAGWQDRAAQAERELAGLEAAAVSDMQRARAAIARYENWAIGFGDVERALQVLENAERTLSDPVWRDEVWARRVAAVLVTQGPSAAVEAFESRSTMTGREPPTWAYAPAAIALCRLGRLDAALDASDRGPVDDPGPTMLLELYPWLRQRCTALTLAGRSVEAEELAVAHYQQALAAGSTEGQARTSSVLAFVAVERGHLAGAIRDGRQSAALGRQLGRKLLVHEALIYLSLAYGLAGRAQDAMTTLSDLNALQVHTAIFEVDLRRARAWAIVAAGDVPGARAVLEDAAALGQQIGDLVGADAVLHDIARLGHAKDVAARLAAMAERIDGSLAKARAAHAAALSRNDPSGLERVSVEFESIGADLLAAESSADAAVSWRRHGDLRAATAADQRGHMFAARCEGASTPALHALTARALLTTAEREAAALAATGRSNKDIAEQLHISVRTVETRLQHAYEKLGITSRAQLRATLGGQTDGFD